MGQVSRARTRQVIAVQGAVKVTPYCRWSIGGKSCCATHSSCKYDSPNKCHDVEVPASHATSGVAGADFVLCDSPRHDFLEYNIDIVLTPPRPSSSGETQSRQ